MTISLRPIGLELPGCDNKITDHFTWKELLVSELCPEEIKHVVLTPINQVNYFHLISTTLEPERVNSHIVTRIEQGKRSMPMRRVLVAAGYSPSLTSQHYCDDEYDCAIDFQKIEKDDNGNVDISTSRERTYNAFIWIKIWCRYGFGQMYYTPPKTDNNIGFVHIGGATPDKQGQVWEK